MTIATHHIDAFAGTVLAPGDHGWDAARQAFNTDIDQQPAAIAMPADAADVASALRFAARQGLQVAPQRTGHNAGPLGDLRNVLLLKTDALDGVAIDERARRVRVGAAITWEQVTPRLSRLGLAALHGSSPDVGIVGYSLGGGVGWLARKHGMQTNAVTAIELVTADGRLVRTDHEHEPELFWALRGGGGNFGVVTAIEFEVHPVRELYAGALFYPLEQTADVLHAWTELLRPLRRLDPEIDSFAMQPPVGLSELAMDPRAPLPFRSAHALIEQLPAAAIEDVARIAGPGSSLAMVQLRHMGGALARHEPGAGARATLPGEICVFGLGVVPDAAAEPAVLSELEALSAATAGQRVGEYPNFVETPVDASGFFDPHTWQRLRRVKAHYDPQDLFKGNHHVPPAQMHAAAA